MTGTSLSCPRGGRETVTHLPPARPWSSFLFLVMLKKNIYFFIGFVTYEPCQAIPEVSQGHLCPQQSPVVFRWVSRLSVTQFPHLRVSRRMGSTPHLSFRPKSGHNKPQERIPVKGDTLVHCRRTPGTTRHPFPAQYLLSHSQKAAFFNNNQILSCHKSSHPIPSPRRAEM